MCNTLLCFMILWANAYFDSLSLNAGLILIFVVPIYFLSISCASAPTTQTTSLGKTLINPALLIFVSMISGFLVVMTALPDIRFTAESRLGPALFSMLLPGSISVAIAQYFFTLTFHMCLFLLGVYWVLVEDRIPGVPTTWRNLASVLLTKLILLLWNPIIPSRGTNLYFIGGLSTYSFQVGRFLSRYGTAHAHASSFLRRRKSHISLAFVCMDRIIIIAAAAAHVALSVQSCRLLLHVVVPHAGQDLVRSTQHQVRIHRSHTHAPVLYAD
jgi:hypothetical protein